MRSADTHRVCICVCVPQYESSGLGLISSRLRTTLNRIQESLIDMVGQQLSVPLYTLRHLFFYSLSSSLSLILLYLYSLHHRLSDTNIISESIFSVFMILFVPLPLLFSLYPPYLFWPILYIKKKKHGQCRHKMHYRSLSDQWSPPL